MLDQILKKMELNGISMLVKHAYIDVINDVNNEERNKLLSDEVLNRIIKLAKRNEIIAYVFIRYIPLAINRGIFDKYISNDLFVDVLYDLFRTKISIVNFFVKTSIYAMEKGFDKKYFNTIKNFLKYCRNSNGVIKFIESVFFVRDYSILQDYSDIVNMLISDCHATDLFIRGFLNSIGVNLEKVYLSIVKDLLNKYPTRLLNFVEKAAYSYNREKWERLIRKYINISQ